MASKAGVRQIALCSAGTLATTPTNALVVGLRGACELIINDFKQGQDYRQRKLRNMLNFKTTPESIQPTMFMLKSLIDFLNLNADAQIITMPQAAGGAGDVFKFMGDNAIGLGFEYLLTAEKRSLKWNLEVAMEFERAKTLIDAADNDTAVAFSGITGDGADFAKYHSPYYIAFESPKATGLVVKPGDIIDRSLSIKTVGKKSIYNTDIVDYLEVVLSLTTRQASIANLITSLCRDMSPSIYWKEGNGSTFFDAFDIAAGVLTQSTELKINDDDRSNKVEFSGRIPVYDATFQFGATYGGDVADTTGLKGGTLKLG